MRRNRRARSIAALLGSAIVLTLIPAGSATASPLRTGAPRVPGPCALAREDGETIQKYSIRMIGCAVERWPVPGGAEKAICIADRESGLIPSASSPTGKYLGLFQHMAAEWPDRYAEWTHPVWELKNNALNGRTNTIVTIRIANAEGWRAWAGTGC